MDPLAIQCKKKLETFRIKELKDVLSRIGAAKQGRKQVLVDKIMAALLLQEEHLNPMGLKLEHGNSRYMMNREKVATVIDEIYRMRQTGAPDLATSIGNGKSSFFSQQKSCELEHVKKYSGYKIRCPCGNQVKSDDMIQCEDRSCLIWQHLSCIIIPEKDDTKPQVPSRFFCEICCLKNGDPFSASVVHLLLPTKITAKFRYGADEGMMQSFEEKFMLSHSERELLRNPGYALQVWCKLLGDEVAFRMHWPLKAELRVNGEFVRPTNRLIQQKLGLNGRDDGPVVTDYVREGVNIISICASDGRNFCVGVRIIRRLTVDEVFHCIPNEREGEDFDMAVSRVRRCFVGCAGSGDDSDSDIEVVTDIVNVNLRCPMSGSRMNLAGRFKPCRHMGCFDLHTFLELVQRTCKWQCPICLKNYTLNDLIIDPFFNRIASALKKYGDDVTEVEMKPDGSWRPKIEGDLIYEYWRSPDGTIATSNKLTSCSQFHEDPFDETIPPFMTSSKWIFDSTQHIDKGPMHVNNKVNDVNLLFVKETLQNHERSYSSDASINNGELNLNQEQVRPSMELLGGRTIANSKLVEAPAASWPSVLIPSELEKPRSPEIIFLSDTEEDVHTEYVKELRVASKEVLNVDVNTEFGRDFNVHVPLGETDSLQRYMNLPLNFFGTSTENLDNQLGLAAFWPEGMHNMPSELFSVVPDVENSTRDHFPIEAMFSITNEQINTSYANCNPEALNLINTETAENGIQSSSTDPSLRIFLPEQPIRCNGEPHIQETMSFPDDSLQEWFSLSLGGSGSFGIMPPPS